MAVRWTLIAVTILFLGWSLLLFAERHSKQILISIISARTSRPIRIGEWEVHLLSMHPTVSARRLTVGNPVWLPAGVTAEVGTVSLLLRWRVALRPLAIERLELEDAHWHLVRDADGRANWHLREEGPGSGPPLMRSLSMPNASVDLRDERRHLMFIGTVSAGDAGSGSVPSALRVDGSGELNGRPVSFRIDADPLKDVRADQAYHFDLSELSGGSRLSGHGYLLQPFNFQALEGNFEINGDDLKDVYYLVGLSMPETGPYHLSGELTRQGKQFVYSRLQVSSGSSDMSGSVTVDGSGGRSHLTANLNSRRIRLADFGEKAAGHVTESDSPPSLRISDRRLRVSGLQRTDVDLGYDAADVELGTHVVRVLVGKMKIERGEITIDRLAFETADGMVEGRGRLDTSKPEARAEISLNVSGLQLADWRGIARADGPIDGTLSARAELTGHGLSLHQLASSASGRVVAVLPAGSIRASIVKSASLELGGMLGLLFKSRKRTAIRCGLADLRIDDGTVTAGSAFLDTDAASVWVSGHAELGTETLDLLVYGAPRTPEPRFHSALAITGTLLHPHIQLAGHAAASESHSPATRASRESWDSGARYVNPELTRSAACFSNASWSP